MAEGPMRLEDELNELRAANGEALRHHPGAAQLIPQFRDIYVTKMLEHLCGPALPAIQLDHERVVNKALGESGQQMLRAQILRPAPPANGRYTSPK